MRSADIVSGGGSAVRVHEPYPGFFLLVLCVLVLLCVEFSERDSAPRRIAATR
jgi:uncharacterized membrane protein YccC